MDFEIKKSGLGAILSLRLQFLHEGNFQFIHNSYHERGWCDHYLFYLNDLKIGYGAVCGTERKLRDMIFEFYILPPFRKFSRRLFADFIHDSSAKFIECQTNDHLICSMFFEFAKNIRTNVILFEDNIPTNLNIPHVDFHKMKDGDIIFEHKGEPPGDYVLELAGEIVATGGFLTHYNFPYADLFMEVREDQRQKGYGSFLIQELIKECYLAGRIPAARTGVDNIASKSTLIKGGLKVCGYELMGEL